MHKPLTWLVVLAVLAVLGAAAPAAGAPTLFVVPGDVENVPVGSSQLLSGAVGNSGDATATVTRLEITGTGAARFAFFDAVTDTQTADCSSGQVCATSLAIDPGSFLDFDISCTPDRSALFTATLVVTSDADNSPTTGILSCDAAGPHVTFDPPIASFADTAIGFSSAPQTVTLTNTGSSDVRYHLVTATDFSSSLDNVDCDDDPCTLFAGNSITITVTFNPLVAGALSEQLIFNADDGSGSATLPLSGNATGPQITVEAPAGSFKPLNLGTALFGTTTAAGTLRIRNTGNAPLVIASALPLGSESEAYTVTAGPVLPVQIAPGDTASWSITCHPVRIGNNSATFTIENNGGLPEFPVQLNCTGSGGVVAVNSPDIPTTQVGQTSTVPMLVSNAGSLPVTITAFTASDPEFTITPPAGGLPITLAAGATATFSLSFTPTSGGPHTTQFVVANDGVLPFTGGDRAIGHTGTADLTPAAPDAGFVALGSTGTVNAMLTNNSAQPLTLTQVMIGDPALVQIDTSQLIGAQLNPDDQLRFAIQVAPGALGAASTTVSFVFDQGAPTTVTVSATGAAPQLAIETWDGSPSDGTIDFGTITLGPPVFELFSITNTGTATLHVSSCMISGGAGAAAFQLDNDCTATLGPRESADFHIGFAPTADGTYTANLAFMSDSNTMLSVPVHGVATTAMPPPGGGSGSGSGSGSSGGHGGGCSIGTNSSSGGLAIIAFSLGIGWLASRRSQRRRPRLTRPVAPALAAAIVILVGCAGPSSPNGDQSQPLDPAATGTLTVVLVGTGEGTVSSLDPGIDCGTTCTETITGDVHLAATPSSGSIFVGWDGPCSGTGPCVVTPAAASANVIARFEHPFTVTVTASGATGEITINGEVCPMPCSRQVLQGTQLALDAFTTSSFNGWSGGCPATPAPCTLTVTTNIDLVAHFAPNGEQWTAIDNDVVATAVTQLAGAPTIAGVAGFDDDIATGSDVLVASYTQAGARSWLVHITVGSNPSVIGLDHDATGNVYVLAHTDDPGDGFGTVVLQKLDSGGHPLWSTTLNNASPNLFESSFFDHDPFANRALAVAPDGDIVIAVQSSTLGFIVRAYAADGTVHWTHDQISAHGIAIDPDGTITIMSDGQFEEGQVERFAADGTQIAQYDLPILPAQNFPEFSYRSFTVAAGELVCTSNSNFGSALVMHAFDAATGTPAWKLDQLTPAIGDDVVFRTDGQGTVVMLDSTNAIHTLNGRTFESRTGPDHITSPGGLVDVIFAQDIAVGTSIYETGRWIRGCPTAGQCPDSQSRTSGFLRVLPLP